MKYKNLAALCALDFQLADALGLKPITYISPEVGHSKPEVYIDQVTGRYPALNFHGHVFAPTRKWATLAPLMVQHGVFPEADYAMDGVSGVTTHWGNESFSVDYEEEEFVVEDEHGQTFVDKDLAVRVAIVRGLIAKLTDKA